MSSIPKKAIFAVTSANDVMYPDGQRTGLFITEAMHPYNVLTKAGFEIQFVSETGKWFPDWLSTTKDYLSGEDLETYNNKDSAFMKALNGLVTPDKIDPKEYSIFFVAGGHGAMADMPSAKGLQKLGSAIWQSSSSLVGSVCHGPILLPYIQDSEGKSIVAGRRMTAFTKQGEIEGGAMEALEKWGQKAISETVESFGAEYVTPPDGPWSAFTVTDGKLVTGTNPASAEKTGEALLEAFSKL